MCLTPALVVYMNEVKADQALQPGARGARKVLVTELYTARERRATDIVWKPPIGGDKCPVQVMPPAEGSSGSEVASFNHLSAQDRHYHKVGMEIYMVMGGTMVIEVEEVNYPLSAGDMIVVNPYAIHEVKPAHPAGKEFLCRVVTINCRGASDKYLDGPQRKSS